MVIHTVKAGDTVFSIARRYGVSPTRLVEDNALLSPDRLVVGQTLLIRFPARTHTVRGGETLDSIARKYGTDPSSLLRMNPHLRGKTVVHPSDILTVASSETPLASVMVHGRCNAAYDKSKLTEAIPYLSTLTIEGGHTRQSGEITLPDGRRQMRECHAEGIPVFAHIDCQEGLPHRERLSDRLQRAEYDGCVLSHIGTAKEATSSLTSLRKWLDREGLRLYVETEENDFLGMPDTYGVYAEESDGLMITRSSMELPFTHLVEGICERASQARRQRIALELPYCAEERGETIRYLPTASVIPLAYRRGCAVGREEEQPCFSYPERGKMHTVVFEDAESMSRGLTVLGESPVGGVCVRVEHTDALVWQLISSLFFTARAERKVSVHFSPSSQPCCPN